MNEMKPSTPNSENINAARILWGTISLAVLFMLVSMYLLTILFRQPHTQVIYFGMAVFLFGSVAAIVSVILALRGRSLLGLQITFFALNILGITIMALFQGRAFTASPAILVLSALVIGWLLPSRLKRSYTGIAAGAFILMWIIEWINPPWRVQLTVAPVGPAGAIIFALILAGMLFFQSRRFVANSLRLQITVWTGAIMAVLSIAILTYSIYTARQTAIQSAQNEALATSKEQASLVQGKLDTALNIARSLASSLGVVKDPNNPVALTRDQANAILRKAEEENPAFLGTWTLWEPNAFDGLDAQYANTPLHDQTGRFIPYWVRGGANNAVEGVAIVDYETPKPGANDWYYGPRATKQETVVPPYFYPINNVNVLMTTIAVPIVANNQFYGVAGVDTRVDFLQGVVDGINLYNGKADAVLFTDQGVVVAARNQPKLALQPANSVFNDFAQFQSRLAAGETLVSLSPDGKYLRVFSPIDIGKTGHWFFTLVIPFSEITAPATASAIREGVISLGIILLSILALWFFSGRLVRPILDLTKVASAISSGDLNATAQVEASNEIGILANTFNSMTSQLSGTLSSLEQRVAARTRNLELAAEVGRAVSQVRSLDVMLKDACELILKEFNLYYVQVYLSNPSQTVLQLEAGTGSVGAQLLARNHNLPLNTGSINGRAALERQSIVIADTTKSATFRQNPLLPETRGEMAVPLMVANKVVGVLDMQSSQPGVLTEEVLPAFEALAGQIAVAIQNANLLAETEDARAQVEAQARRLVQQGWHEYLDAIHKPEQLGFIFDHNQLIPLAKADEAHLIEVAQAVSAPIAVTGEALGSLVVEVNDEMRFEQTSDLVNIVARQVAQQIENLRLLESAERYRYEAEQASKLQTLAGWQKYINSRPENTLGYLYDTKEVLPYQESLLEEKAALVVPLKTNDEKIGKLAVQGLTPENQEAVNLANAVVERLSAHIENLRLLEETRQGQLELNKRAQDLVAVSEISSASTKELDIQKMLEMVVHLTQRKFGLYHAHVFVYDEQTNLMRIAACGWKAGDEHEGTHGTAAIPLDQEQSLVARAARTRQSVIVNDVHNEPGWLPNPLLPDTQSELAVPLLIGDQILGVLDVQSDRLNAFNDEDASIQTTLASQVATALQNARSFNQAQAALAQSEKLFNASRNLTQAADLQQLVATAVGTLNIPSINRAILNVFNYDTSGNIESLDVIANWSNGTGHEVTNVGTHYSREIIRAMTMFVSPTPVFFSDTLNDERVDEVTMQLVKRLNLRAVAVLPLHVASGQIGALILEAEEPHVFTAEETRLFTAIAPQIATIMDNRRQFERTQKQAEREAMLNIINQKIQSATSVEAVLQIAARELGHALGAPMTVAQLSMKDKAS